MKLVPREEQAGGHSTGKGRPVGTGPAGGDPVRGLGRTAGGVRVGGGGRPAEGDPVQGLGRIAGGARFKGGDRLTRAGGPQPWSCSAPLSCESSRGWGLAQM